MKVVIAPDSFKGSLSAKEVAEAVEKGFLKVSKDLRITKVPMADGGEGTVESLVDATGGTIIRVRVKDPILRETEAFYGILGDGETAVIEMAAASGLPLLSPEERNPLVTTTYGTGQLILSAIEMGCKTIILGLGGSATNDGGSGMARALGVKFMDAEGQEIEFGGGSLDRLATIDCSAMHHGVNTVKFIVACDVDNPLCGEKGASKVFGPQKGATKEMVETLDQNLMHYGKLLEAYLQKEIVQFPGAGAAGGLGAGVLAFLKAELKRGIEIVIEATQLEEALKDADLVVTGEGMIDFQTAFGKTPQGVASLAQKYNIPVIVVAGAIGRDAHTLYDQGIDTIFSIVDKPMPLDDAIEQASQLLEDTAERIMRTIKLFNRHS
ncbi:glycerate kinase [Paenibacillus cremeus]|uniref:Glycerate kinase n=1 Tax=Paenibacillus cremeus TaxID=2163881 RepID=A0A559K780_9BACL|nr:glycerate kinase [Paenibacillus cremeus]TVY07977.1 glycerate kinase [Paenibacillus cremeus]